MGKSTAERLYGGTPLWVARELPSLSITEPPAQTDVAVVGAGITGALMAESLSAAGFSVSVFDAREPFCGATAASTALVQYELDTPFVKLCQQLGEDAAKQVWSRSRASLEQLAALIENYAIDCFPARRDSLYLPGDLLASDGLESEVKARCAAGFDAQYIAGSELYARYGIKAPAALRSTGSMAVDPLRLCAGLLELVIARGGGLHAPMPITRISHEENGLRICAANGQEIRAKALVFATGYELPEYIAATTIRHYATWAMATQPQPHNLWPEQPFVWEAANSYFYLRSSADGRAVCGGGDETFRGNEQRDSAMPEKTRALQVKLSRLFPQLDAQAEFSWAGHFCTTTHGLPMFGPVPDMPHCYALLAYGGNGMTLGKMAAESICRSIKGETDPHAALFAIR